MNMPMAALLTVSLITTAITPNKIIAGIVVLIIIVAVAIWSMRRSKAS
ncbi:MAG: hypothetical protein ABI401_16520 [Candidatus Dormibacter sp.]